MFFKAKSAAQSAQKNIPIVFIPPPPKKKIRSQNRNRLSRRAYGPFIVSSLNSVEYLKPNFFRCEFFGASHTLK